MPKPLSPEVREAIKMQLLEGKRDHIDIADEMNVSLQTVKNYSASLRTFESILPPQMSRCGRPPILTKQMVLVCVLGLDL